MPDDYNPLGVPKGCELRIRADRSACFLPKFEPPKTQFLIAREIPKPAPAPERVASVSGVERQRLEAIAKYRNDFLIAMRERAKDLTQESGFRAAAVEAWESGIDDLISEVARHL